MQKQDHHLFSTLPTTPHCAATAKARLSSPLFCTSTAKGGMAWAATEYCLYLCQGPQTSLCNELQKAKCCAECISTDHHLSKRFASLPPIWEHHVNKPRSLQQQWSKCSPAASSSNTSSHVPLLTVQQGTVWSGPYPYRITSPMENVKLSHDKSEKLQNKAFSDNLS